MKTAIITGITGQDGSYLADYLLSKKEVYIHPDGMEDVPEYTVDMNLAIMAAKKACLFNICSLWIDAENTTDFCVEVVSNKFLTLLDILPKSFVTKLG